MSLSDLLKKSAMQICYLRKNKEKTPPVTPGQIAGNEAAHAKSESEYIEMRGTFKVGMKSQDLLIHYAFDEIKLLDKACVLIEHKMIKPGSVVELWYRNASILQTVVYQAFALVNPDRNLETATFFVDQGNPKLSVNIGNSYIRSELHLGDMVFSATAIKQEKIVRFYVDKAKATLNYDTAKEFDAKYKHKEFELLNEYFNFRTLEESKTIKIK